MNPQSTVLVIEDFEPTRRLIAAYLKDLPDVSVLQAKTGEEGIALIRTHFPSLVILDLQLPGISGEEVLDTIKGDSSIARIPIVVMTASDPEGGSLERILLKGASDYLRKPVEKEDLKQYVKARLALARTVSRLRHDFSNPLTAVLSYAELLTFEPTCSNPAEVKEYAQEIMRAGEKLLEMYSKILGR